MLTTLWSWLGARVATLASLLGRPRDSSLSSTSQGYGRSADAGPQSDPIATLQVHDPGSREVLDTSIPFFELTDVESAMRHEGAIPPGRYAVFRDISGRILLQARGISPWLRASSSPR